MYTHVLDQHGIVYNQPIVLNERQAGVAIEGVTRHNENRDDGGLQRLSVDTHGYTDVGMTVSKLLGFDLCPRLRNLSERKLHLPRGMVAPAGLTAVVANEVSIKVIRNSWDGLLHVVASIHAGRVSAIVALQRFGSAAQGDPVFPACNRHRTHRVGWPNSRGSSIKGSVPITFTLAMSGCIGFSSRLKSVGQTTDGTRIASCSPASSH